jgi:hypothetical protein
MSCKKNKGIYCNGCELSGCHEDCYLDNDEDIIDIKEVK